MTVAEKQNKKTAVWLLLGGGIVDGDGELEVAGEPEAQALGNVYR